MAEASGRSGYPWHPDQGDGTFRNPVLYADYSDPDVVRVGEDYYLTASSFNCTPGLPILHSRDLVNWTIIGHALKQVPGEQYREVQAGCGVYAPSIRHHAGKFWIFFPTPEEGIYVITAPSATGPWSEPHLLLGGRGLIDPCPLWDDDGKAYLVHAYARSRAGIKDKLHVRPMAPDGMSLLGEGKIVYDEPEEQPTLEGPKFMKRNGFYYLIAPAGQVAAGWQVVLRSREVYGPYECRVLMDQGNTPVNGPHQGALLDTPSGEWWFMHFQELQPWGRIVHLQPAGWQDDWPWMGVNPDANGVREPVLRHVKPRSASPESRAIPQAGDEFEGPALGFQWQWHANHEDDWASLSVRPGFLRMKARPFEVPERAANRLTQKLPAPSLAAETRIELPTGELGMGVEAGIVVTGRESAMLLCERTEHGQRVKLWMQGGLVAEREIGPGSVRMLLRVHEGGYCSFAYGEGAGTLRDFAMRFLAREGVWIGATFGIVVRGKGGYADFDYFRVMGLEQAPACGLPRKT
jgi:beta-xylosidase